MPETIKPSDTMKDTIKTIMMILGLVAVCASPIIAVTVTSQTGRAANAKAEKALGLAEQNARDFAFFKGEVNAKLDNLTKGQDRVLDFVSKLERAD